MSAPIDRLRVELQHKLTGAFSSRLYPYSQAAVLILYWDEDDFRPSCREEAQKVSHMFRVDFHYDTTVFQIPSVRPQHLLEQAVITFKCANDGDSSLLIVYYTGHGDPDESRNKAVWAAKGAGGPVVDWYQIQPLFRNAEGDVLFIFDCCHASLAAKERNKGKWELLAASPAGGATPCPGPFSFTQHFVDVLQAARKERDGLQVVELQYLIHQKSEQTPVYFNLRSEPENSILLRPLKLETSNAFGTGPADKVAPGSAFTFTISVLEPPSKRNVQQLGEWIKTTAPKAVSAIKVDRIIDLSNSLQDFVLDEDKAGVKGRLLDSLSPTERALLISQFRGLGETCVNAWVAQPVSEEESLVTADPLESKNQQARLNLLQNLEERNTKISQIVWSLVGRHPAYQTVSDLERLKENPAAQHAGISEAARLNLLAQDLTTPTASYIPPEDIIYKRMMKKGGEQFMFGTTGNRQIIVEIVKYKTSFKDDSLDLDTQKKPLIKMCSLLANSKPEYYRILPCVGYTHERFQQWFGLVFEIPTELHSYSTLLSEFKKRPRVPLETRYWLAYTLALSLLGLHSVHWVHKGIQSENILFFNRTKNVTQRHIEPWLFGFEYAREDAQASDDSVDFRLKRSIYFPPSRWGKPSEKFSYQHDIYAFGVLLLEIGFWTSMLEFDKKALEKASAIPEQIQGLLINLAAGENLCHFLGTKFSRAVIGCLTGKTGDGEGRDLDFESDVVNVLRELAIGSKSSLMQ